MNATHTIDRAKLDQALATMSSPWKLYAYQGAKMPLGLAAGLRMDHLDGTSCTISLPGGWRTQNPFGSMYWAAQGMAAEMATGIHGVAMVQAAPGKVRMILAGCSARFTRMGKGRCRFVFEQGDKVEAAIAETLRTGETVNCDVDVIGYDPGGEQVSAWTFTWSFRAKK